MNDWVNVAKFKERAALYMQLYSITVLRTYGRKIGVPNATTLKLEELIREIIAVLCGEKKPKFTRVGAPRKNEFIPPELIVGIDELVKVYLRDEASTLPTSPTPVAQEEKESEKPYYTITVQNRNGEKVMSLGTSLDFQILISNQRPIARQDVAQELDEKTL